MKNEHYYTQNPQSEHDFHELQYEYHSNTLNFTTDSSVFSKTKLDQGTEILLNTLTDLSGTVLDIGCGWGAIGVSVGKAFPGCHVTMTDINERACELSRQNALKNGVSAEILQSDGWNVIAGRKFDAIIQNPPIRAGKAVIYQMFADAAKGLADGGEYRIVIRKQQGAPSAAQYLQTLFYHVETIERKAGYWILRCTDPIA